LSQKADEIKKITTFEASGLCLLDFPEFFWVGSGETELLSVSMTISKWAYEIK